MGLFIVILKMRHVIVLYSKNTGCTTATRHTKAWGAVTLADWQMSVRMREENGRSAFQSQLNGTFRSVSCFIAQERNA